jgi:ABC-type Mn2+/Zn2+ transport system permease subunit
MTWLVFAAPLLACALGGATAGGAGVLVNGLRMPFITVCSSHAAMAGAVFGLLLQERTGVKIPLEVCGFLGALSGASLLAFALRKRKNDPNAALGAIFSLMLGLGFLGIGLLEGPKSAALTLLWGNPVFVTRGQLVTMAVIFALLLAFLVFFEREIKLLLFSRELAHALVNEALILRLTLFLISAVITINLQTVGGLLLFSLISNPSIAALRVARNFRSALVLSAVFGALAGLGGFAAAYALDLPAGACIVLVSCLIVGLCEARRLVDAKRKVHQHA